MIVAEEHLRGVGTDRDDVFALQIPQRGAQ